MLSNVRVNSKATRISESTCDLRHLDVLHSSHIAFPLVTNVVANRTAEISGFLADRGSNGTDLPIAPTDVIASALGKGISKATDLVREHRPNKTCNSKTSR
jgi:hypothetical protein